MAASADSLDAASGSERHVERIDQELVKHREREAAARQLVDQQIGVCTRSRPNAIEPSSPPSAATTAAWL